MGGDFRPAAGLQPRADLHPCGRPLPLHADGGAHADGRNGGVLGGPKVEHPAGRRRFCRRTGGLRRAGRDDLSADRRLGQRHRALDGHVRQK